MNSGDLNLFIEVVQEVMARGCAPSLTNIAVHLSPKGRECQIAEALQLLVADGRLVKVPAVLNFDGDDNTTDLVCYYPSVSSGTG